MSSLVPAVLLAADEIAARYIDPDLADRYAETLRTQAARGAYDHLAGPELTDRVTGDLHAVAVDRHLRVRWNDQPAMDPVGVDLYSDPAWLASFWAEHARENYGGRRVEVLDNNLGLFVLDAVDEAAFIAPMLDAAFAFLARTDALVLDLRANTGGEPTGVAHLVSHLVGPGIPLIEIDTRAPGGAQSTTTGPVAGAPYDKPVAVLVSTGTFSGGEEIAYDLQALGRAQVVGERTVGAANPVGVYRVHPHVTVRVPEARVRNVRTGTSWEGVGVVPDIECPADEALTAALAALR